MEEFDISNNKFSFEGLEDIEEPNKETYDESMEEKLKKNSRRTVALKERETKTIYRRAFSETQLMDAVGNDFKHGEIYHCLTAGDVDGMSYLKLMVRAQKIKFVLLSTWVMANDDILQLEEWLKNGSIKKCDVYVGEIFPNSYRAEYEELKRIITPDIGRIAVFKNHSKIFAGHGSKFYFGIQTSANINTNPRTENGCISISKKLFEFYKSYFDGIISFDKTNNHE